MEVLVGETIHVAVVSQGQGVGAILDSKVDVVLWTPNGIVCGKGAVRVKANEAVRCSAHSRGAY